ncbi:hypothetical protein [Reyranella sp. CPCC 100927]|uniref:hypothetical protein n=1 Tax=Reyranella sp. CPCC 100927 TaxID=2599616 RepID=UPI0011B3E186|nr:hypothetical protein [Reyranella sp. CPCC 100927]TWS94691.1 hypothetical protein FQU96_40925 [Reyranella sp. CPCC 100927]
MAMVAGPSWGQAPTAPAPTTPAPSSSPSAAAPPQAPAKPTKPAYEVKGFRSANFGMTEAEVRAAIQKDFGVKPDDIRQTSNAIERTAALMVSVPSLDPGPGPATAIYILGYQSKKLIQVNVVWSREAKNDKDKVDTGPYIVAGVQLVNYFNEFGWRDGRVNLGIPIGPSTLLLFAAEDEKTGAVQVVADGVAVERKAEGRIEAAPQPGGQASLRVSYIANRTTPDIFKLERGRF